MGFYGFPSFFLLISMGFHKKIPYALCLIYDKPFVACIYGWLTSTQRYYIGKHSIHGASGTELLEEIIALNTVLFMVVG